MSYRLRFAVAIISLCTGFSDCRAPSTCGAADLDCNPVAAALFAKKRTARFVYASSSGSNNISALYVNYRTGSPLASPATFAAGTQPDVLAVDPFGRFLYCANFGADSITSYTINQTTGSLTAVQTIALTATSTPAGLVVFSDYLLVSSRGLDTVQAFRREANGTLSSSGSAVGVLATGQPRNGVVHPNGRFIYVGLEAGSFGLARITANNGSITYNGNTALSGGATNIFDAAITSDGRFVIAAALGGSKGFIYSVDSTTGNLTEVSTYALPNPVSHGIIAHPYLPIVYVGYDSGSSSIDAFQISNSGVLTPFSTATMAGGFNKSLSIDPQGGFLYTVNTTQGFSMAPLNASTGAFTTGTATAVAAAGTPAYTVIASFYDYLW